MEGVRGKRRRTVESDGEQLREKKVEDEQVREEARVNGVNGNGKTDEGEEKAGDASAFQSAEVEGSDDEEESGDEVLVVLELCDFKNHPLLDDYSSATLEGIDTATPKLRIGEYELHGQLEETVGTSYFYDTDTSKVPDKTYQFAGQTIRKIKFTIAPPDDP